MGAQSRGSRGAVGLSGQQVLAIEMMAATRGPPSFTSEVYPIPAESDRARRVLGQIVAQFQLMGNSEKTVVPVCLPHIFS